MSTAQREGIVVLVVDDSPVDRHLAGQLLVRGMGTHVLYAADGEAALEVMRETLPDIVVTDLQMPKVDGLALVAEIRSRYPFVPTILMTAHGSEDIAVSALRRGAASYVPKLELAQRLAETVRDVLALACGGRQHMRLKECWAKTEFEFVLENDVTLISPLISHLQQYLSSLGHSDETEIVRVGVALHEALRNAIHHGNLEMDSALRDHDSESYYRLAEQRALAQPYLQRRVRVRVSESPVEARYVITDDGAGFTPAAVADPTELANMERPRGRGLFLIRMFMDEVQFNSRGNEITLVHRRDNKRPAGAN